MPKSLFVDPSVVRAPSMVSFKDIPVNQYNKTVKEELESGRYTKEDLIRIFRDMTVLREFETMLNNIKTQGGYNGIDHTSRPRSPVHRSGSSLCRSGIPAGRERLRFRFSPLPLRNSG